MNPTYICSSLHWNTITSIGFQRIAEALQNNGSLSHLKWVFMSLFFFKYINSRAKRVKNKRMIFHFKVDFIEFTVISHFLFFSILNIFWCMISIVDNFLWIDLYFFFLLSQSSTEPNWRYWVWGDCTSIAI